MKASFDPSGDHAGDWLDFFALVSWRVAPAVASASQISVSYALSSQFVSRTVYATSVRPARSPASRRASATGSDRRVGTARQLPAALCGAEQRRCRQAQRAPAQRCSSSAQYRTSQWYKQRLVCREFWEEYFNAQNVRRISRSPHSSWRSSAPAFAGDRHGSKSVDMACYNGRQVEHRRRSQDAERRHRRTARLAARRPASRWRCSPATARSPDCRQPRCRQERQAHRARQPHRRGSHGDDDGPRRQR